MTYSTDREELSLGTDYETVAKKFRPIFEKIAATELIREKNRTLPYDEIDWLKNAGFGAVRVPKKYGGDGVSIPQLFQLLIELATADSNISQALRGHFALVEDRLVAHRSSSQEKWFKRFVAGEIAGNAWTETGNNTVGSLNTVLIPNENGYLATGKKFYTTGTIFAEWIDLTAKHQQTGNTLSAIVKNQAPQIEVLDDWDGFGQRTTGSGTATLKEAWVEKEDVLNFEDRFNYQTAFYQAVLNSTLSGIANHASTEFANEVKNRKRVFSHGNSNQVRHDPQILQVIGRASAQAFAINATTIKATESIQEVYESYFQDDEKIKQNANNQAELESAKAQVVVADLTLRLTSDLFHALSASAAIEEKQLDRFWRNARTISSHNPIIYKEKAIADWEINQHELPFAWSIGLGKTGS